MELPELIASLAARPGPVLTWYGEHRTELGGAVAARWLAKTANLLAGDLAGDLFGEDAGLGSDAGEVPGPSSADGWPEDTTPTGTIRVDLGCSWQSVTWLAAAWLSGWRSVGTGVAGIDEGVAAPSVGGDGLAGAGAGTGAGSEDPGVDVWVSERIGAEHLAAAAEGCRVLAQATTPLALSWPGPLPEGVLDALAELAAQSDALEIVPEVSPDLVVAEQDPDSGGTGSVRVSDLGEDDRRAAAEATSTADADAGGRAFSRVLLTSMDPQEDARSVLTHWAAGRSVVVVDHQFHDTPDRSSISRMEGAAKTSL